MYGRTINNRDWETQHLRDFLPAASTADYMMTGIGEYGHFMTSVSYHNDYNCALALTRIRTLCEMISTGQPTR